MTRKEKTLDFIRRLTWESEKGGLDEVRGFDANEISRISGFDRANVSRDLNELVIENKLRKSVGRPVLFFLNDNNVLPTDMKATLGGYGAADAINADLDDLVGASGSLKSAIDLAHTSILYPQKLNMLLTGDTGVGKTTFAERVYVDARKSGLISNNAAFLTFNCSEYADNPQLLLSHLFGHKKGSFTGAERDKSGIVEDANGGILLLDEIHRLGAEGQEMLFQLIDKGQYRRLGETGKMRTASIILIGATTEDVGSFLLHTFLRRFPVVIRIPSLVERPTAERLELILRYFCYEANRISLPIRVENGAIHYLLCYTCPGNIGQLSSDIKLACAQSFSKHIEDGQEILIDRSAILIGKRPLPLVTPEKDAEISMLLDGIDAFQIIGDKDTPNNSEENVRTLNLKLLRKFINALQPDKEEPALLMNAPMNDIIINDTGDVSSACIITTCMTGEGSAVKIADYIEKNIPRIKESGIRTIAINIGSIAGSELPEGVNTPIIAVVGTVDPCFPDITFIPIEDLIFGDGEQRLSALIENVLEPPISEADIEAKKTRALLKEATQFIDTDKVIAVGMEAFSRLSLSISSEALRSIRIRFLLHLACMLERVLQKLPLETSSCAPDSIPHYAQLRDSVSIIETSFGVEIPDSEIRFLEDLLMQYLC